MSLIPALLITLALFAAPIGRAGNGDARNPGILPPSSTPFGKTYSQWGAAWWRWALSIPAANNPVLDQTGEDAAIGQSGHVWFLAGTFGGSADRTVSVPAGKALLVALLNTAYVGFPCDDRNLPGCEADAAFEAANDVAGLLALISGSLDRAAQSCEIDGRPVQNLQSYREQSSEIFSLSMPEGNVFDLPAGSYHPCVDTGYYLLLAPLSAGHHTIHFIGANSDGSFRMEVTYHLTVGR